MVARDVAADPLPPPVDAPKATIETIGVESDDEQRDVPEASNAGPAVAVDVAAEQAVLLRKGIGDMFVSLVRRNQVLIDRQIEFLDRLEATEERADALGHLYQLDHLATRMRRNAESLLVLAGAEPHRDRSEPVGLIDVVRAATSETEDYTRVELLSFDDAEVIGIGAVDLGHLLAELIENATRFSPPDQHVTVEGRLARSGYVLTILDAGVGMPIAQVDEVNALLLSPPPVGFALNGSLGFTVVARLAARHSIGVRLTLATDAGIVATVHLPAHLLADVVGAQAPNPALAVLPATPTPISIPVQVVVGPPMAPEPTSGRSPDDVRAMLANYRTGLKLGHSEETPGRG